jgi:hypothetical protein
MLMTIYWVKYKCYKENTKSLLVASKEAGVAAYEGKLSTVELGYNVIEGTE